jgi:CRISPR-associated protein Cas1
MKKFLNTLYVTTQGAYLCKEGETIVIKVENVETRRLPIHTIGSIICFGQISCSPFLMGFCGENNVGLSFLTEHGKFLARVEGAVSGNVLLRRTQFRKADDLIFCGELARAFIAGKITNSRNVLMRAMRDHGDKPGMEQIEPIAARLKANLQLLKDTSDLDKIRGIEGDSASLYFSVFDHLITAQKESFYFHERNRRPPQDNMNALLSYLYTILMHDVASALESVGLDPAVGFLHRDRPGRPGLALDLMEEFRPILADRLALSLVNLQQVQPKGFRHVESGAVVMDDETRKKLLIAYQERKREEIMVTFLDEHAPLGLLPHLQALMLARFLRGDLDGYPPFVWK